MKKIVPIIIIGVVVVGIVAFSLIKKRDANKEAPKLVETPPTVSKVNTKALGLRPYVELVPHDNADTAIGCSGVDLNIDHLKNGEKNVEYELEYTTAKQIQGVFGRRDFSQNTQHKPLEFGTCSKGRCVCDKGITGGTLKLTFSGSETYVLKGDFSVGVVGENQGNMTSADARLLVNPTESLPRSSRVLITSTMGLPKDLPDKVILGPYGIFVERTSNLKKPLTVTLQSQDVSKGKIQFYDGSNWQVLSPKASDGDKATVELSKLGVLVLTE